MRSGTTAIFQMWIFYDSNYVFGSRGGNQNLFLNGYQEEADIILPFDSKGTPKG